MQKRFNDDNKKGVQSSDNHVGWIMDMTVYNDYDTIIVQKGYNDDNKKGVQSSDNRVGWI